MRRVYKTASARLAPNFLSDSDNFGTLLLNIEDDGTVERVDCKLSSFVE